MTEPSQELPEEARIALSKGAADGPELLRWLQDNHHDVGSAVAMMSWVIAWMVHKAPCERSADSVLGALMSSTSIYGDFLADMAEAEDAETPDKEVKH